ncbi:MAG: 50S ribosomal protein L13 [Candidatus Spechtbacteria bacterium SB0662_bin_43]|uniref:Large ribosomal subunit protein uL13 n=1 Tax=Candidatus Spechtbacteria bacterium SB0662_bin_43 TaxID=2604897 RepID=A0A845DEL4_9BACT|nr:50S ribosomal protein L13 [Candidatus Spechtbacteria bacterium SB0662_bin_43]
MSKDIKALQTITLDAKGKVLGRLATQAAFYLQGKHLPEYEPHHDIQQPVTITNIGSIVVTGKKATQKMYYHYSGYPGGLRSRSYEDQFQRDPTEVVRKAIYGMLPSNKLRSRRMSRVTFEV